MYYYEQHWQEQLPYIPTLVYPEPDMTPTPPPPPPPPPPPRTATRRSEPARPREKKHGCWMCEKSFDRPSTLRKHLLVHTGEKAFVCDICGRRFGVASNLNRHVKRCILKPVHARTQPPSPPSPPSPPCTLTSTNTSTNTKTPPAPKRPREPEAPSKPPAKRRRRAPSPSQWIPNSLAEFNITPVEYAKPTTVPLPPVTAYRDPSSNEWIEERNSWDENAASPYHPCGWKGTLPGPGVGLGGKDVMNLGLVHGDTYIMGRLVMV